MSGIARRLIGVTKGGSLSTTYLGRSDYNTNGSGTHN